MNIHILQKNLEEACNNFAITSKKHKLKLITAESCTGGMISASLTEISGLSEYIEGGFVTYSNIMKQIILNVPHNILTEFGSVSEQVAIAMADGALKKSINANISIAVTGIAGPNSDDTHKPVGLVWIAAKFKNNKAITKKYLFSGNRAAIRLQTATKSLELLELIIQYI